MNTTLYILHLFANTENLVVNKVATERYNNLLIELKEQGINDFVLHPGIYNPDNPKKAIHEGHRDIVQLAKDNNWENVIIAEDDIKFTNPNSWQYFLSQIPEVYDLFFGLLYQGEIKDNRVVNGFNGCMTLYVVHNRFYDTFLSQPVDTHVDVQLGNVCFQHEFKIIPQYCVIQRGGYSLNRREIQFYDVYLENKTLYGQ